MFRFEHPEYFIAFALVPILIGALLMYRWLAQRSAARVATPDAWSRLLADLSRRKILLRHFAGLFAVALLCIALANPQWGIRRETVQAKSADIFIALDISNSMLAQDVAPSRLERAKKFAQSLISAFRGERIGIILFAGNAYLHMPLTSDYAAAELFLRSAHPRLAATQGTAIGEAVDMAMRAYEEDAQHHKALVIITDGENHEDGAVESMEKGRERGLVPFVIAVGTEEGGLIPMLIQGREDYKRDAQGNPVRTAVNPQFLGQLAAAGKGTLYRLTDDDSIISDMRSRIESLEKREMEQRAFKEYESYYQYFLLAALIMLLFEMLIGNRKSRNSIAL
ncbi:MAG: VWA domain-containing protein [Saprospiraceae bacterium]|nr:VWA domain-containing protein [Saprospiraceae bacterium]